jgi:putative intracellular protease/amidase
MEIAILIYDKLAALDAVGPYEVMRNVPGWDVRFVAKEKGDTRTEDG